MRIRTDFRSCNLLAVLALLLFLVGAAPTSAGRFCADRVEGGLASGETVEKAREAATAWWSSRAGSLGRGYGDWKSAEDKDITCETGPEGSTKCKAVGKPCLPEGMTPENVPKLDL